MAGFRIDSWKLQRRGYSDDVGIVNGMQIAGVVLGRTKRKVGSGYSLVAEFAAGVVEQTLDCFAH